MTHKKTLHFQKNFIEEYARRILCRTQVNQKHGIGSRLTATQINSQSICLGVNSQTYRLAVYLGSYLPDSSQKNVIEWLTKKRYTFKKALLRNTHGEHYVEPELTKNTESELLNNNSNIINQQTAREQVSLTVCCLML